MKIIRNILILLMIVLFCGYLIGVSATVSPQSGERICKRVEARVLDADERMFINEKDVVAHLGRMHQKYIGTQLKNIDYRAVETAIAQNPFVSFVSCYAMPNGTLRVDVRQREPKLRVMSDFGNYYIDSERRRMPTSTRFSAYVPVVSGVIDEKFLVGELFDFVEEMQSDDFWSSQITQIVIGAHNEVSLVPRVGNHLILLGKLENVEQKLDKMMIFYRKGLPNIGWNRYRKIDLRYKNQVVCTKW